MTRQDILVQARDMLGEVQGDPQAGSPFAWNKLISQAADEVARRTDCNYATVTTPIVAGTAQYCLPQVYKVKAVSLWIADGSRHTLASSTVAAMDDWSATWRDETSQTQPTTWIPTGLNAFALYPVPNYSSTLFSYTDLAIQNGNNTQVTSSARPFSTADVNLTVQVTSSTSGWVPGFYKIISVNGSIATLATSPGTAGSTSGAGSLTSGGLAIEGYATFGTGTDAQAWDSPTADCPLPHRAHYAVVLKAVLLRIMQNPTDLNLRRQQLIQQEYQSELGSLEAEVRRFADATRQPSYTGGSLPGTQANPLNL